MATRGRHYENEPLQAPPGTVWCRILQPGELPFPADLFAEPVTITGTFCPECEREGDGFIARPHVHV